MENRRTVRESWSNQYVTHPVLGPVVFCPNVALIICIFVAVIAGVPPGNEWLWLASMTIPTLSLAVAGFIALTRPAPKWRDGRWHW